MANDCPDHAGTRNRLRRNILDEIMKYLPENQSGVGRHKCAYCAYEQGYADGLRRAGDTLRTLLLREAGSNEQKRHS